MSREAFTEQNFGRGDRECPPWDVPLGHDRVTLRVPRTTLESLPRAEAFRATIVMTVDGGPRVVRGMLGFGGGPISQRQGGENSDEWFITLWLPESARPRQLSVVLSCDRPARIGVIVETAADGADLAPRQGRPPQSPAIDTEGFVATGTGTTLSGSITVGSNSNRILFGYLAQNCFDNTPKAISTFTFNGDPLVLGQQNLSGNNIQQDVYTRDAPDIGTATLSVSCTPDINTRGTLMYISAYDCGTLGAFASGDGTSSASASCAGSDSGLALAFGASAGSDSMTIAVTDGTPLTEQENTNLAAALATEAGSSGGNTLAFSGTGGSIFMGAIAVCIAPLAGGGSILPLIACDMRNIADMVGMRG